MHDLVEVTDQLNADAIRLHLGPQKWSSFATNAPLSWDSVPWDKGQKTAIPKVRGIYAFTVRFTNPLLPDHGYILYVGIAGDKKSKGTLRSRFWNYFREREDGRTRVAYMLQKWDGHLDFQFAEVPDRRYSLEKLEKSLCDAVVPFASRNDLSAKLRKGKEAAGL
jgi:hypothetical protein